MEERQILETRLTKLLGITHPVIQAPMAMAAGGRLAAAVGGAGGLGMIGGGYGDTPSSDADASWLDEQFNAAGNVRVGCGFITWALEGHEHRLDAALAHKPAALMLSFGKTGGLAAKVRDAGVPLVMQVQCLESARAAIDDGADIVVAQGTEAGGHGGARATLALVPEIADLLAGSSHDPVLVAAGGIADGRGLAAALVLGAHGALCGTRFWASREALVPSGFLDAAVAANGDSTVRTSVVDMARRRDWPPGFAIRVVGNEFTRRWHGREDELAADLDAAANAYAAAYDAGDARGAAPIAGEAIGIVAGVRPAAEIVESMVAQAAGCLDAGLANVIGGGR